MPAILHLLLILISSMGFASLLQSSAEDPAVKPSQDENGPSMIVFSKTSGFRHQSIPQGVACFRQLGADLGLEVIATEDASIFTAENLADVSVVVFLNTTGDVLDQPQQDAFEAYIRAGGSWLGVHAAADTEYEWPFYGRLVGAYFKSHPAIQEARITVEIRNHPSTRMLPGLWRRTDEWYTYKMSPREGVTVLASLDEGSFTGGGMNGDHPIAWCHEFEGGRALYTGGGHTAASYEEREFKAHLRGSLAWLIGSEPSPPTSPKESSDGGASEAD